MTKASRIRNRSTFILSETDGSTLDDLRPCNFITMNLHEVILNGALLEMITQASGKTACCQANVSRFLIKMGTPINRTIEFINEIGFRQRALLSGR